MEVYQQLEKARDLIAQGWIAGVRRSADFSNPRYCALGALDYSNLKGDILYSNIKFRNSCYKALFDAIPEHLKNESQYDEFNCRPLGPLPPDDEYTIQCWIAWFSNMMGQEKTVELFNKAIRMEKEKAGILVDIPEATKTEIEEPVEISEPNKEIEKIA